MTRPQALSQYLDTLPLTWKWSVPFSPPQGFAAEWNRWLAAAQRAELEATLRFWAQRKPE